MQVALSLPGLVCTCVCVCVLVKLFLNQDTAPGGLQLPAITASLLPNCPLGIRTSSLPPFLQSLAAPFQEPSDDAKLRPQRPDLKSGAMGGVCGAGRRLVFCEQMIPILPRANEQAGVRGWFPSDSDSQHCCPLNNAFQLLKFWFVLFLPFFCSFSFN